MKLKLDFNLNLNLESALSHSGEKKKDNSTDWLKGSKSNNKLKSIGDGQGY